MRAKLVDTGFLSDFLLGEPVAGEILERSLHRVSVSALTVAELYQCAGNRPERGILDELLMAMNVLSVNMDIAREGGWLHAKYAASHQIGLVDCLTAATALHHDLQLITNDPSRYPMLKHRRLEIIRRPTLARPVLIQASTGEAVSRSTMKEPGR